MPGGAAVSTIWPMSEDDEAEAQFEPTPVGRNGNSPDTPDGVPPTRRRSPLITLFLLLTGAAVVAPFIAVGVAFVTHSGPFAHTIFPVTVHNDGSAAVVVRGCGGNCTTKDQAVTLQPGGAVQVGATNNGSMSRYYLHDVTGTVLGCLPLVYHHTATGVSVQTSEAETCPGSPLPENGPPPSPSATPSASPASSPTPNPNIEGP